MNIVQWFFIAIILAATIATKISLIRQRRENDRVNGKGWRKRLKNRSY
jgi:hypothetical protein